LAPPHDHDGKNAEEKIGKANPHWRPVDVHVSNLFSIVVSVAPKAADPSAAPSSGGSTLRVKAAERGSALSDAHDFDELACREVAKWRAFGEVLLGFDAAPQFVRYLAYNRDVSREAGSGAQSWGAMPATQIMATMLKVMGTRSC
jgi:hypothetical protein